MINTKKVQNRREVHYANLDDFLNDACKLSETSVRTVGNWSQGQIYLHLARAMNGSIDGVDMRVPAPMRWIMILLFKKKFLEKALPAGFPAPDGPLKPDVTSPEEGLDALRQAVERQRRETRRVPHPAFGNLGPEGWRKFHLRHAEMHMSFILADEAQSSDENSSGS